MSFRSYDLLKLVEDHGETLTLRKLTTSGSYNPGTGSISGSATTDYVFEGYFFNFSLGLPTGDEIRRGTRKCVIPALGLNVVPDDDDLIIGQGDNVKIMSVTTIFNSGVAICYICEVKE